MLAMEFAKTGVLKLAKSSNLEKLSLQDLKSLRRDVDKAIASFEDRKRAAARKELEDVAKKHGMSVDQILGLKGGKRKAKTAPKYRNPDNSADTWSGRGRQPAWFKAAIAAGKSPDNLAI